MATIIKNRENKLTESQQKEIVERCNEAYDRGGADVLKTLVETANQIAIDTPEYREYVAFSLYLIEAIRQKLSEVVNAAEHDTLPVASLILAP